MILMHRLTLMDKPTVSAFVWFLLKNKPTVRKKIVSLVSNQTTAFMAPGKAEIEEMKRIGSRKRSV